MFDVGHIWRAAGAMLCLAAAEASGQVVVGADGIDLTVEAYANLTGAAAQADLGGDLRGPPKGFADGAVRAYGRVKDGEWSLGSRVVVESATDDALRFGERSLVLTHPWGRFELGYRQGLPDVLTGYAPNPFQFVSQEFGPASGASLDPNGGLQTRVLSGDLRRQIDAMSILGVSPSTFADQSPKLIYVSPKAAGYLLGLSYAPRIEGGRGTGHDRGLAQTGLVKEIYSGDDIYRLGGSYAYAEGRRDPGASRDGLHSVSAGGEAILDASLALGLSVTWNGRTGLADAPAGPTFHGQTLGVAGSVNWTEGPWQIGAYVQWARSPGDVTRDGDDRLVAAQIGGAYRFTTKLRVFAAWWHYDFSDEGGRSPAAQHGSDVFLIGFRAQL